MLNKIEFAVLVQWLNSRGLQPLDRYEMGTLESMTTPSEVAGQKVPVILVDDIIRAVVEDRKIEAIKAYRALTGIGLKEAKDAVERCLPCAWSGKWKTLVDEADVVCLKLEHPDAHVYIMDQERLRSAINDVRR